MSVPGTVAPYADLLRTRKSPTSSVSSIEPEMTVQVWITNVRITRKSRKPMNSDFVHSQAERPRVRSCCCAVAGRDCFDCDRLRFDVAMGPAVRGYGRQRPALQEDTLLTA